MRFSGARLRQLRRQAGLRVVDLAYTLDLGITSIYSWETGRICPSADHVGKLAAYFEVPPTAFYEATTAEV